jgi:hydrogenase maturation protein HypF
MVKKITIDESLLVCEPFEVPFEYERPVLGVGAELKSSVCLIDRGLVYLSRAVDDLSGSDNYRKFLSIADVFVRQLDKEKAVVAYDLHPEYAASRYALSLGMESYGVGHHHAHIAACMAENGVYVPVTGIAADGTGFGDDGAIWGGEILNSDISDYERAGHFRYFSLFGGDKASVETWRPLAGLLFEIYGDVWSDKFGGFFSGLEGLSLKAANSAFTGGRAVKSSSTGRLFDAAAFLLGICEGNYEPAAAPIALEGAACESGDEGVVYNYDVLEGDGGVLILDWEGLVRDMISALRKGVDVKVIARGFHNTLAVMLADGAKKSAIAAGNEQVLLSGGCFLNKILTEKVSKLLKSDGFEVISHGKLLPGDNSVSLGQALIVLKKLIEGKS